LPIPIPTCSRVRRTSLPEAKSPEPSTDSNVTILRRRRIDTLILILPIAAFSIPFATLFLLYPQSFDGSPSWEGTWQGRFFYVFFLWIVALVSILRRTELQSRVDRLKSPRAIAFFTTLALPTIYVGATNYFGLGIITAELGRQGVYHARLIPLATEYIVFALSFELLVLLAYGVAAARPFSFSALFLGLVGLMYIIDDVYPGGRFVPFQVLVVPTATLAATVLNNIGYQTTMILRTSSQLGYMPTLIVRDATNTSRVAFSIAWPCAGIESILIYTVTVLMFLTFLPASRRRKVVYFLVGALVTYLVNILRIVSIFVVAINHGDWMRFHNIYGPLYSIIWIVSYPAIIIGTQSLWKFIKSH